MRNRSSCSEKKTIPVDLTAYARRMDTAPPESFEGEPSTAPIDLAGYASHAQGASGFAIPVAVPVGREVSEVRATVVSVLDIPIHFEESTSERGLATVPEAEPPAPEAAATAPEALAPLTPPRAPSGLFTVSGSGVLPDPPMAGDPGAIGPSPSLNHVPFFRVSEADLGWYNFDPASAAVVSQIDGATSVQALVRRVDMPWEDVLAVLGRLTVSGILGFR